MHDEKWSHENQWLSEFETAFVRDTRDWIQQLTIENEVDAVAIGGSVNSFYAVQLAIQAVKEFCRQQTPFAATRLSLDVAGDPLELKLVHEHTAQVAKRLAPKSKSRERRSELTAI